MNKYEIMLILDPSLSDEERKAALDSTKSDIALAGKVEKEDVWGERRFAYKINGSNTGFYILLYVDVDGTKIKEITDKINLNKKIWRNMFVKLDA